MKLSTSGLNKSQTKEVKLVDILHSLPVLFAKYNALTTSLQNREEEKFFVVPTNKKTQKTVYIYIYISFSLLHSLSLHL